MSIMTINANTSGYTVDVVEPNSNATNGGTNKAFKAFFAVFIGLFLAVSSVFAAPSASASWIDDAVRSVFCSSIYFNAKPDGVWGQPSTVEGKDLDTYKMTAYEKYGTSGANWTVWVGPDTADEFKDAGEMGGRSLVSLAGGEKNNGGLDNWKGDAESAPVFYNADQACGDPVNFGWSMVGNFLMMINGGVVYITGFVFQTAYESSSSIISVMEGTDAKPGPITQLVKTLTDSFYMAFFNIMVMLAALWMGYKGLVKKQSTEMAQGAIWMISAAIIGMFMLAQPLFISKTVNTGVMTISEAAISTVTSQSTNALGGDDANALCYVEESGNAADAEGNKLKTTARGTVRAFQCSMWESFIYNPWTTGQFGHIAGQSSENGVNYVNATGQEPGAYGVLHKDTPVLANAAIPTKIDMGGRDIDADWARLQLDSRVSHQLDGGDPRKLSVTQGRHMLHIASAQTMRDDPNKTWAGQSSINRVFTATIALIASVGAAIMIVILAMEMIILQIGLVILVLLAPIFALVGVHPGFGRRVALMWLNTIAELALRRIVLSILLALMVLFYSIVLNASATAPWMVSMIMVVAVSIAGLMYKNKVLGMFSNSLNMGGAGSMRMPGENDIPGAILKKGMGIAGNAAGTAGKGLAGGITGLAIGAGAQALSGAGGRKNGMGNMPGGMGDGAAKTSTPEQSGSHAPHRPNGIPGDRTGVAQNGNVLDGAGMVPMDGKSELEPDTGVLGVVPVPGVGEDVRPVEHHDPSDYQDKADTAELPGAGDVRPAVAEAYRMDEQDGKHSPDAFQTVSAPGALPVPAVPADSHGAADADRKGNRGTDAVSAETLSGAGVVPAQVTASKDAASTGKVTSKKRSVSVKGKNAVVAARKAKAAQGLVPAKIASPAQVALAPSKRDAVKRTRQSVPVKPVQVASQAGVQGVQNAPTATNAAPVAKESQTGAQPRGSTTALPPVTPVAAPAPDAGAPVVERRDPRDFYEAALADMPPKARRQDIKKPAAQKFVEDALRGSRSGAGAVVGKAIKDELRVNEAHRKLDQAWEATLYKNMESKADQDQKQRQHQANQEFARQQQEARRQEQEAKRQSQEAQRTANQEVQQAKRIAIQDAQRAKANAEKVATAEKLSAIKVQEARTKRQEAAQEREAAKAKTAAAKATATGGTKPKPSPKPTATKGVGPVKPVPTQAPSGQPSRQALGDRRPQ